MFWLLAALLAVYACFLPMTIQADVHHHDQTQARIIAQYTLLAKEWRISGLPGAAAQFRQSRSRLLLDALIRADKARKFLLHHIHLDRLDALILLHTGDAARSSLLSGGLQGALTCIPAAQRKAVRIRVLPEFFRAHSTVQARCIIRIRLGTLILTAMMLLAAYFRQRRVQKARHAYGTSHW